MPKVETYKKTSVEVIRETTFTIDELDSDTLESCSKAVFDNGEIYIDEMAWVENDKVALSSSDNGILNFSESEKQYVSHVYFREKKMGQFKYAINYEALDSTIQKEPVNV